MSSDESDNKVHVTWNHDHDMTHFFKLQIFSVPRGEKNEAIVKLHFVQKINTISNIDVTDYSAFSYIIKYTIFNIDLVH